MQQSKAKPCGLKAIAEKANVSVSLASKVLNGRMGNSGVNPVKAEAIRTTARELNYRKNHAAAALVTGRQNVIGAFVHSIGIESSGICEQLVRGMAAGAAKHGLRMMLRFFVTAQEFLGYIREISPTLLDGMVLAGIRHRDLEERMRKIESSGVRLVTVQDHLSVTLGNQEPPFVNVAADQVKIGRMGTEHLIACGCRRIAHIGGIVKSRVLGYSLALQDAGLSQDSQLIYQAKTFEYPDGAAAIREFAARGVEFDGLVAESDAQAMGALNALLASGKRIPDDVKVIGVDNSPLCSIVPVSLSSISSNFYVQGELAVDLLANRIESQPAKSVWIDPVLYPRVSTVGADAADVSDPIERAVDMEDMTKDLPEEDQAL